LGEIKFWDKTSEDLMKETPICLLSATTENFKEVIWNFGGIESQIEFEIKCTEIRHTYIDEQIMHQSTQYQLEDSNESLRKLSNKASPHTKFHTTNDNKMLAKNHRKTLLVKIKNSIIGKEIVSNFENATSVRLSIDEDLDIILEKKIRKKPDLSKRKDVIYKTLLRSFRKFICSELSYSKNMASHTSESKRKSIILQAIEIGLIDMLNPEMSDEDYIELICWMSFAKHTKQTEAYTRSSNSSIKLLEDVLTRYSHTKLETLFLDKNIKQVFQYYYKHGANRMLDLLPAKNRREYEEGINFFKMKICQSYKLT
jgi:hypothetical protein